MSTARSRGILVLLLLTPGVATQAPVGFRAEIASPPRLVFADGELPLTATVVGAEVADGALHMRGEHAHATFGPDRRLGVRAEQSFAIELEVRTQAPGFSTIVMCREGKHVHYSFVLGRRPGHVSFEPWYWSREGIESAQRLDDGRWHRLVAGYDADTGLSALIVDGQLAGTRVLSKLFTGSATPTLRIGENIDPAVSQQFVGEVRALALHRTLPEDVTAAMTRQRRATVLDATAIDDALAAWLAWQRRPRAPAAADAASWNARAARIRANVQDAIGLWPPPYATGEGRTRAGRAGPLDGEDGKATDFATFVPTLPLAERRGGTLRGEGFTLTRTWWQSFQGYWAGGWLYEPAGTATARRPAVLCPHGHWDNGARHPTVQARCIALARLGCVVLVVDSVHFEDARLGLSSLSLMTWNNLRGLELLRARADVDPARIACTGASGGGQQTYYLTALQTGLCAAVPAVMACHFEDILLADGVHCYCNHTPHLLRAADMPEMAAAFAPRPQLFLTVTGDWTRRFAEHGFPAVQQVYDRLGAAGAVAVRRWTKGHDYDRPMREAMYSFLWPLLAGAPLAEGSGETDQPPPFDVGAMTALGRDGPPQDLQAVRAEFAARLTAPAGRPVADARAAFARLLERADGDGVALAKAPAVRRLGTVEIDGRAVEQLAIAADRFVELPALWLPAKDPGAPAVIVIAARGKADVLGRRRAWLDALAERGLGVLLADVRYTGELDRGASWRALYGRMFGADEGVLAVHDLRRLVVAVRDLGAAPRVGVLGFDDRDAPALLAAALDRTIAAVAVPDRGPGYGAADRTPLLSRIHLHGDLDDAVACLEGRPLIAGRDPVAVAHDLAVALRQ